MTDVTWDALSPLLAEVRRLDPERAPLVAFATAPLRAPFAAALAIQAELARACEEAGEEMVALVRLAWWREALTEARPTGHPALGVLAGLEQAGRIRQVLLEVLEARTGFVEARGFETVEAYLAYARATSGRLHRLLAELAGYAPPLGEAAEVAGAAYGAAGLLRSARAYARRGTSVLPRELVATRRVLAAASGVRVPEVAEASRHLLERAHEAFPRPARRAALVRLPATLARRSHRQLARAGFDPFDPRVGPLILGALDWGLLLRGIRPRA